MFGKQNNETAKVFANSESFRLCTEGLQALERYERRASRADLEAAEIQLLECVRRYPADMLPKFYLGSVKTLTGYRGLNEAVALLTEVIEGGPENLRAVATYNLAAAHIQQYDETGFKEAERLLNQLATQAPEGDYIDRRLIWLARVRMLYIRADRIWHRRRRKTFEDRSAGELIAPLEQDFASFYSAFEKTEFNRDPELIARYWNALGTLREAQAWFLSDRQQYGAQARAAYEIALEHKRGWVATTSNLARLYHEILNDKAKARELLAHVFQVRPDDSYAFFLLGSIDLDEGKLQDARVNFAKAAPNIPEAKTALDDLNAG